MSLEDLRVRYERMCQQAGIDPGSDTNGHCPCPDHPDKNPSLSIKLDEAAGKILLICRSGCDFGKVVEAFGFTQKEMFADSKPSGGKSKAKGPVKKSNVDLVYLSNLCQLPISELTKWWGLENRQDDFWGKWVQVPYWDEKGNRLSLIRRRLDLPGKKYNCKTGQKTSIYGLQHLKRIKELGWVILIEGESDCWVLRHYHYPCLGLPSSSAMSKIQAHYLADIRTIYVYHEPGKGGFNFIYKVPRRLKELGWNGNIYRLRLDGYKDPRELHVKAGEEEFKRIFEAALAAKLDLNTLADSVESLAQKPDGALFPLTDLGNAERMVKYFGEDLIFCTEFNEWFLWNGVWWERDRRCQVRHQACKTVRRIYAEAAAADDRKECKEIIEHALKSEGGQRIEALIRLTQAQKGVPVVAEQLDVHPWLFTCANGTVDLRSGKLLPSRRDYLLTKHSPVTFDSKAECPAWDKFILEIMNGNEEMATFLQRACGYCLTGSIREHCMFICYGEGANGKSTFLETVQYILGEFACTTPTETLLHDKFKGNQIPADVARLRGVRFTSANETEEGQRLAESKIKDLTGGDKVAARFLYGKYFEFHPEFKLWLRTNNKPVVRGQDEGIWRRLKLIPFEVSFEGRKDEELPSKLAVEAAGILQWMVRGCLEWQKRGLDFPPKVQAAIQKYRQESDVVGLFIEDCCEVNEYFDVAKGELYEQYVIWSKGNRFSPMSHKAFAQRIAKREILDRRSGKAHYWVGIRLLTDEEIANRLNDEGVTDDQSVMVSQKKGMPTRIQEELQENQSQRSSTDTPAENAGPSEPLDMTQFDP